jgi:hypothetical protein
MNDRNEGEKRKHGNRSLTLFALTPVALILLLSIINFDYVSELLAREAPYIYGIPCGWIVLLTIGLLILLTHFVLWLATLIAWLPGRLLIRIIAALLIVIAVFIVLLAPAAFVILRNEALQGVFG